jgi:large subunit ribosomal protein L21
MVVDGDQVLSTPSELSGASVSAQIVEEVKGRKIDGFTYKSKSNNRRRYGHRQTYATIKITGISKG